MNEAVLEKKPVDSDDHTGPKVSFEHVASLQEVKFRVDWSSTLQSAWDEAYRQRPLASTVGQSSTGALEQHWRTPMIKGSTRAFR